MKEFHLTSDHIILLKNSAVSTNDMYLGSATIDPKYPYGDSRIIPSMIRLLLPERKWPDFESEDIPEELYDDMLSLHNDMETVLEIALPRIDQPLRTGKYVKEGYSSDWQYKPQTIDIDPEDSDTSSLKEPDATLQKKAEEDETGKITDEEAVLQDTHAQKTSMNTDPVKTHGQWTPYFENQIKEGPKYKYRIQTKSGQKHEGYFRDEGFIDERGMWILAGQETLDKKIERLQTINHPEDEQ